VGVVWPRSVAHVYTAGVPRSALLYKAVQLISVLVLNIIVMIIVTVSIINLQFNQIELPPFINHTLEELQIGTYSNITTARLRCLIAY